MKRTSRIIEITELTGAETDPGPGDGLTLLETRTFDETDGLAAGTTVVTRAYQHTFTWPTPEPPAENWLPTDEASLIAWYDATDGATITLDTGAVSQWNDKSSNGYNLIQGNATYRPTVATAAINGQNAIEFDDNGAAGEALYRGTLAFPESFQVVMAVELETLANERYFLRFGGNNVSVHIHVLANTVIGNIFFGANNAGEWFTASASPGLYLIRMVLDKAGNLHKGYVNGKLTPNYTKTNGYQTAINSSGTDDLAIGARGSTGSQGFAGRVGGVEFYSDITDTVGQKAEGRLAHLFGITLPAGHPYENEAP